MSTTVIIVIAAAAVIAAFAIAWTYAGRRAQEKLRREIAALDEEISRRDAAISERDAQIIRKDAEIRTAEQLRQIEREQHERTLEELRASQEKAIAEIKAGQDKAIEAAKTALALENEKALKAREESLKREAAETMRVITGGLDKDIKDMKDAFDAQKKTHVEESASIKTQFAETVRHLKEQTDSIGNTAEDLAKALKGQSKVQGIFGETILENIFKAEGLREGHDYDSEVWLRDRKGNRLVNEESGKTMRPDFALHFPDDTDVLIDAKVSLTALSDYFAADTDEQRAEAAARNLESVRNHVKELTSKEYQKYVVGRKTLDYVIMFIPNYAAYQLAKMEDKDIFAEAFRQNVLITTEETLIPFLRLIRTAWVQKEQMENISEIVSAAKNMVDRVALFCEENAKIEENMESVLKRFKKNSARLVESDQSIVGAAWKAISHGIAKPATHILPPERPVSLQEKPQLPAKGASSEKP